MTLPDIFDFDKTLGSKV